jgi:hypothetical protein
MRKTLAFGVVLAAAYLTGSLGAAYAQTGAGGQAGRGNAARRAVGAAPDNVEQRAAQASGRTSRTTPSPAALGQTTTTVPGRTIGGVPAPGTMITTPANTYKTPRMTGTVANPVGTVTTYPGTATYSSNDYQAGTYPRTYMGAIPAYTNQIMPGYSSVNPLATAIPPGPYAGAAGTPYTTYYTPGYASPYGATGYYTTQPYGNVVQPRGYGYPYYGYASGYGYGDPYYATAYAAPGVGVTYSSAYVAPAGSAANAVMPAQGRDLGIDEEPITDAVGQRGVKVTNVYPGTAAERAGLRVGDVIYAGNGYLTEQRGNLAWIIANAAPHTRLNMSVKTARDRREHFLTAELP